MIATEGISLAYGQRVLFSDVSIKFTPGNCYGVIGANGAGKSTFLKILSREIPADHGEILVTPGQRVAYLRQNQFEFDEVTALATVLMGNKPLYELMVEKEALYAKADFSDEDGLRASELEARFAELNGWDAEAQAAELLSALGVAEEQHHKLMKELEAGIKVRVLLAQAICGNPDVLLLDEPTNNLDLPSIMWLEEFLCEFKNTVIVVSHDRHFLDKVCTHIADIDFGKITLYTGNYSFWYQASQLALKQRREANRKAEDKAKELKTFIERFSANASKSRQATSRKKLLDKLSIDDIKPSSRKYPHIYFQEEREAGRDLLQVNGLSAVSEEGRPLLRNFDLSVVKGEKIAFVGRDGAPASVLFQILAGEKQPPSGSARFGITVKTGYFPKENSAYFSGKLNLIDWLRQYAGEGERDEEYIRGFLGKMLFSGEETQKTVNVLSGGEKVRCMLSRLMMTRANVLILDEPTNHLDLESITALNNGLMEFKGTLLFTSQDREFVETIATRIIEILPKGVIDRSMPYGEYLESEQVIAERARLS